MEAQTTNAQEGLIEIMTQMANRLWELAEGDQHYAELWDLAYRQYGIYDIRIHLKAFGGDDHASDRE